MAKPKIITDQTRDLGPLFGRALIDSKTINKEARTIEVVAATETPVRMYRWDGPFNEILSMKPSNVRMARINGGAPVLNDHVRYLGVQGQLGVVEKCWIANGEMRALLRFSKRDDVEKVWQDIVDGIIRGISVGYRVFEYEITQKEDGLDEYRAIDWEPFEISLAPVHADPNSGIRNASKEDQYDVKLKLAVPANSNRTMEDEQTPGGTPPVTTAARSEGGAQPKPAAPVNVEELQRAAVAGERARVTAITEAVRKANLPAEFAAELVNGGKTIDQARALIIDKFAEADPAKGKDGAPAAGQRSVQNTQVTTDEADKRRSAMSDAIIFRAAPGSLKPEEIKGNEYRNMNLLRMAEEVLKANNVETRGMSSREIASNALGLSVRNGGQVHSTDFPIILGNTINRRLMAEYALADQTFQQWCTRGSVSDFREVTRVYTTELGDMSEVKESGEYKDVYFGEGAEKYKVTKYGSMIHVSWETLINDDLGAFNRIPSMIANTARRKQSDIVYAILTANAAMGDGTALFHANHKNLAGAAAISDTALAASRLLLRNMKGKAETDFLNLIASYILCGPSQETNALKYTSAEYLPNSQAQINPWRNFTPIVEPRITDNAWYLLCKPGAVNTVEYSFLDGEEMYTESRVNFERDGVSTKVRMVFGAKALDWKGMIKNPGA